MKIVLANPTAGIDKKVKAIIKRGNIACFTNKITGVVKKVKEWNSDKNGDLTAFYSTGSTKYVCPYAVEYEISEIVVDGKKKGGKVKARKKKMIFVGDNDHEPEKSGWIEVK